MSTLEQLREQVESYFRQLGRSEHVFDLRPEKAALLVVDMQEFVCNPKDGRTMPGIEPVIAAVNRLADRCRQSAVPVIWLRQNFNRNEGEDDSGLYALFHKKPLSPGMFNQGPETKISSRMHFDPSVDHVVLKNRYSAVAPNASNLDELIVELGIEQLWICGAATNVCVESTARDAMQRDIQVIMISDAITSPFELIHHIALMNIKAFFGDVRSAEDILQELKR